MWPALYSSSLLHRILLWTFQITREDAALSSSDNVFASIPPSKVLQWHSCFSVAHSAPFRGVECARLIVPLNYSNASSGDAQIAIIRLRASPKGTANAGSPVFFNPGGPGGDPYGCSVEEFLKGTAARVWANYAPGSDIIGIVPRAVGSTFPPAGCYRTEGSRISRLRELAFNNELGYTNASIDIMEANAFGFGIDCADTSGDVLPYMGTVNTAQDMNHVLKKLGFEKLKFIGFSYGTVLGATYAALFPEKIDRMVLDGVQDSNHWFANGAAPGLDIGDVDAALNSFFAACFAAGPDRCSIWCPGGSAEIRSYFFEADRCIQRRPINVPQFGLFEFPQWRYAAYGALFQPSLAFLNFAQLVSEVYEGIAGDAVKGVLRAQGKSGFPANPPLVDKQTKLSNGIESLWTIECLDRMLIQATAKIQEPRRTFEQYRDVSELGRNKAYYDIICDSFPVRSKATLPRRFENINTSYPILFVGNTADPTTPLRNAVSMSKAFPGSHVLVINGTGHTSMFSDPSLTCALEWIVPYVTNGSLPPNGTVCQANADPFNI